MDIRGLETGCLINNVYKFQSTPPLWQIISMRCRQNHPLFLTFNKFVINPLEYLFYHENISHLAQMTDACCAMEPKIFFEDISWGRTAAF
jgi:hypothetical protein